MSSVNQKGESGSVIHVTLRPLRSMGEASEEEQKSMLAAVTGIATAAMLGAAAMPANAQGTPTPGARATLRQQSDQQHP